MTSGRLPWPLVFQVLGVIFAVWVVIRTWELWLLVFTALIIAAAILPAARLGERHRVPRAVTVAVVYVGLAGVLVLMGRLLWPALAEQWTQFIEQLPRIVENVKGWVGNIELYLGQWGGSVPTPKAQNLQDLVGAVLANAVRVTAGVFGAVVAFLVVVVVAAYVVIDAEHLGRGLLQLFPPPQRRVIAELGEPVIDRIGAYVRGQIAVSLCVGIILAIGLSILGVRYALLIGALATVLNVVPFIGSLVAAILGILSALNESPALAIGAALLFWGANLVEGKLLVPQLVGRATGLHPLAVMVVLLAGAQLGGLVGALVSVPFLAAAWEITRAVYIAQHRS
jgi:predicted PurR-regulated permease PerM